MSTLLFIIVISLLLLGYRLYGDLVSKVFGINPARKTPAYTKGDGVDYVPAKNWFVAFGHHFASIAGAGPIIGPILAYMMWGWLAVVIWIVFGTIFMGAVHDFSALFISLREDGVSVGQIAKKYISKKSGIFFLVFLWFSLILVIAVFAAICAKSFVSQPQVVTSSLGLIPVAMLVGFLIYKLRINIIFATAIGVIGLAGLILLGSVFPISLEVNNPYAVWIIVLFIYAFFASIIPVDILLQPRDYLSSFLLFFGVVAAFVGLILKPVSLTGAKLFSFNSSAGYLFPVMFITVACGATSGFHSLVASGTTSKQLSNERDAKKVGYGAMILEGILAAIVLFAVAFKLKNIPEGSEPATIFSMGFSSATYFLGGYGKFIALVILNAFILTTLDSATRITRFITQELLGVSNKFLATGLVVFLGGYLAFMNKWQMLWPIFGASNQLVAAIVLIVASAWLFSKGKNYKITLIPGIVMLIITIFALILKVFEFYQKEEIVLLIISFALIIFSIISVIEFRKILKCRSN